MTKLLKIEKCLDCPHHEMISDPGSDDSFDAMDEAMVCKLAGPVEYPDRDFKHRPIVRASRWPREFEVPIPRWCPLPGTKKKAKR